MYSSECGSSAFNESRAGDFPEFCNAIGKDISEGMCFLEVLPRQTIGLKYQHEINLTDFAYCLFSTFAQFDQQKSYIISAVMAREFARSIKVDAVGPPTTPAWSIAGKLATVAIMAEKGSQVTQCAILHELFSRQGTSITIRHSKGKVSGIRHTVKFVYGLLGTSGDSVHASTATSSALDAFDIGPCFSCLLDEQSSRNIIKSQGLPHSPQKCVRLRDSSQSVLSSESCIMGPCVGKRQGRRVDKSSDAHVLQDPEDYAGQWVQPLAVPLGKRFYGTNRLSAAARRECADRNRADEDFERRHA